MLLQAYSTVNIMSLLSRDHKLSHSDIQDFKIDWERIEMTSLKCWQEEPHLKKDDVRTFGER